MSTADRKIYYCDSCGGVMVFDPKSQSLKCPNCGTSENIVDEKTTREHRLSEYTPSGVSSEVKTSKTMECNGCGAQIEIEKEVAAVTCPYCSSNIVLASKQLAAIIPDGIKPFQIHKKEVGEIFKNWLKGRWLAPNELKNLYQQDKVMGIYLPYWTFDAQMECSYSAMGGKDRQVAYEDSDGNTKYRTETDWYRVSGDVSAFFDDVLVRGSLTLQADLMERIGNFNTRSVVSYSPAYISGYASEVHTVEFHDAHTYAIDKMDDRTKSLIEADVLRRYDRVSDIDMSPSYSDETYKHILLPVYSTAYSYKGKVYNVLINGETGLIAGDYPKSVFKIALLILIAIILVAIFYFVSEKSDLSMGIFYEWAEWIDISLG